VKEAAIAPSIDRWQHWLKQGSIQGIEMQRLADLLAARSQELANHPQSIVLLAESDATHFLAGLMAATAAGCPLVLGNPSWAIEEWRQVGGLRAGVVWAEGNGWEADETDGLVGGERFLSVNAPILIPTGGSSGKIRFAVHTWQTLMSSAIGFQKYFECDRINSCCVLPLYHVSGLIQVVRSFLTQGSLAVFCSRELGSQVALFDPSEFFLSLVPTQLQRLLQEPATAQWLSKFQTVLLGGAPAWDELLQQARQHQIRLAPTYGMTETASQVVTLKPADFLRGKTGCGQVLPHAIVKILDEAGAELPIETLGTIAIQAASLMRGYYSSVDSSLESLVDSPLFLTDDLGYFDAQGYLHILGRSSQKIITGGENVFPAEVEAAIRSTGLVRDVCVVGVGDCTWGEVVTACVVVHPQVTTEGLAAAIEPRLASYKRPKRWVLVPELPRNAQGKINYLAIGLLGSTRL
jgi:o-succinylbenzoate---CoA ligase